MSLQVYRPRATAADLPAELWVDIFTYLDYPTLKALTRVNKLFSLLLKRSIGKYCTEIDKRLFRDIPLDISTTVHLSQANKRREFIIHPLFSRDFHVTTPSATYAMVYGSARGLGSHAIGEILAMFLRPHGENLELWEENGVSPSIDLIWLKSDPAPEPGTTATRREHVNWKLAEGKKKRISVSGYENGVAVTVFDVLLGMVVLSHQEELYSTMSMRELWDQSGMEDTRENEEEGIDLTEELRQSIEWILLKMKYSDLLGRIVGVERHSEESAVALEDRIQRFKERAVGYDFNRNWLKYRLKAKAKCGEC